VFVLPILVAWLWFKQNRKEKIRLALAVIIAGVIAYALAKLAGHLHDNPRPFVSDGTPALINHANDNGFPSEHTVLAMTLTTLIYFYKRWVATVALILTILVGWGRVAAHVHHGLDILVGIGIGFVSGLLGYWLSRLALDSQKSKQSPDKL